VNLQFFTWLEVQSLCQPASVGGQHGGVEKKTPIEYLPATDGGIKPWQGFRNPAEGHRDQNNITGVVSVNPKKHHFLLDYIRN
jgi:hypothetical protein